MFKVVVINGPAASGKDTFVEMCRKYPRWIVHNISTIDYVKHIAAECGWTGTKTPTDRWFLCELKKLLSSYNDSPYQTVAHMVNELKLNYQNSDEIFNEVVFIHVREPLEIKRWVADYDALTLKVERSDNAMGAQYNTSDMSVDDYVYDYVVDNDGSLDDLEAQAGNFLHRLGELA